MELATAWLVFVPPPAVLGVAAEPEAGGAPCSSGTALPDALAPVSLPGVLPSMGGWPSAGTCDSVTAESMPDLRLWPAQPRII